VASALPIPDSIMPLLLAFVGGVLTQAAWVALTLAHQQGPADRRVLGVPAAMAMTLAAVLTALFVHVGTVNR
jgi:ZIP family zinc transporter